MARKFRIKTEGYIDILEAKGEEWFFEQIVEGNTVSKIATELNIGQRAIYFWLHRTDERWKLFQEAKALSAHTLADEALAIADESTNDTARGDRMRVDVRRWMAESRNRQEYGQQPAVQITTTINSIHLQALDATPEQLAEVRARILSKRPEPKMIEQVASV